MPLMTLDQWKRKTSRFLSDRTNPLITDIDILLGEYHKASKTDVQKLKLVILIRRYCRQWLVEKADKKKSFRRPYVDDLLGQTTRELESEATKHAIDARRAGGSVPKPGKQLEETIIEMLQPRASSKDKYGLQADMNMPRMSGPNIEDRLANLPASNPIDPHNVIGVLDFIQDETARGKVKRNLEYLQKADRIAYKLELGADGLFHRGGAELPHSSPANENELYAIDQLECIYTANAPAMGGTFHHSSFLSGKPVLCAGEIRLERGKILHIDNGSGHYKPNTQNLLNAVNLLERNYHLDLRTIAIKDFAQPNATWSSAGLFRFFNGQPTKALPKIPGR